MVAVALEEGMGAEELRAAAAAAKDANQARRLLALAAVRDGMSREAAARIGGMDRQTLRDWVHAFNEGGIDALINDTSPGRPAKLTDEQRMEIKALVGKGPDFDKDGIVRWRCIDLVGVVKDRFDVTVSEDTIGRLLRQLGFSHISVRPKHPEQKEGTIQAFKKKASWRSSTRR
jgi:transposase